MLSVWISGELGLQVIIGIFLIREAASIIDYVVSGVLWGCGCGWGCECDCGY